MRSERSIELLSVAASTAFALARHQHHIGTCVIKCVAVKYFTYGVFIPYSPLPT